MTTVLIIILILSQLICFYFIILLNLKISKFKDLEVRQDKLMNEMNDAISAYILEMREENDRLIKELSQLQSEKEKVEEKNNQPLEINNAKKVSTNNEIEIQIDQKKIVPKNLVVNAYEKQKTKKDENEVVNNKKDEKKEPQPLEHQVFQLHKEGKSIEEIAKITEKGKTEIELLLKFHK